MYIYIYIYIYVQGCIIILYLYDVSWYKLNRYDNFACYIFFWWTLEAFCDRSGTLRYFAHHLRRKCERPWRSSSRWVSPFTEEKWQGNLRDEKEIYVYRFLFVGILILVNVTKSDGWTYFCRWSCGYRASRIDRLNSVERLNSIWRESC